MAREAFSPEGWRQYFRAFFQVAWSPENVKNIFAGRHASMDLIESRNFTDPELAALESQAIDVAQNNTDALLDAYAPFGCRYICADTFKELMPRFGESFETRR